MDEASDAELIDAIAGGSRDALRALYDRHAPWLLLRVTRRHPDPGVVEEVVQDTFVSVWRKAATFSGRGEVAAWLWGIAIRRLVDRLRSRRRIERLRWLGRGRDEPSAEDVVLTGIEYGDLAGALNRLSPELRSVLQATALDGLTNREAAELLGVPIGTVKSRLARARAEMRQSLA